MGSLTREQKHEGKARDRPVWSEALALEQGQRNAAQHREPDRDDIKPQNKRDRPDSARRNPRSRATNDQHERHGRDNALQIIEQEVRQRQHAYTKNATRKASNPLRDRPQDRPCLGPLTRPGYRLITSE